MELIDRYLQAVGFWLPREKRGDIIAELSEEIRSQAEVREREAGRKLDDPELAAILRRLGPPMTIASRYLPQRSLIGPVVFPAYVLVLKIVFVCCAAPQVLLLLGLWPFGAGHPGEPWLTALGRAGSATWLSLLSAGGLVTLIFAVIEGVAARTKPASDWDPLKLPPVRDSLAIPRSSSIFDLAFSVLIVALWARYLGFQTVFDVPGARITLNPSWVGFMQGFVVVMLGHAAVAGVNLLRPRWTPVRAWFRLATDCAGGALFCWFLKAGVLREVSTSTKAAGAADTVNAALSSLFPFALLVGAVVLFMDVRRLLRAGEKILKQPEQP